MACVLMFCLAREEFPVDTHVWRISKSLGWVPAKATRDTTYEHLNVRVPPDVRWDPDRLCLTVTQDIGVESSDVSAHLQCSAAQ